jgi:Ca2+/H+ antiporter, TMEM165/GDT1 family
MFESMEWTYLAVFVLAAIPWIELAAVVPLGILFGLAPVPVGILGFAGNWLTVVLLILLFDQFQQWRLKRKSSRREAMAVASETRMEAGTEVEAEGAEEEAEGAAMTSKRGQRAKRIWHRYGLPGLALIGPFFVGSHIAAAVAMAFKAPRRLVTMWMSISLVAWTIVLAVAAYYGFDALGVIRPGLFEAALHRMVQ